MKVCSNNTKNPLEALGNLVRKHAHHKTGIIILGGGMSTVWAASISECLQKNNIRGDVYFGVSGGAPIAAAAVRGYAHQVVPVYEHLAGYPFFIKLDYFCRPFLDLEYLIKLLPGNFDEERPDLHAIVTTSPWGASEIHRLNLQVLKTTMSIPGLCPPQKIGDKWYVDGACAPLPLKKIIRDFGLTDVIIIASRPIDDVPARDNWSYWLSTHAALAWVAPSAIRCGMANMDYATIQLLSEVRDCSARAMIIYPSYAKALPPFKHWLSDLNAASVRANAQYAAEEMDKLIEMVYQARSHAA